MEIYWLCQMFIIQDNSFFKKVINKANTKIHPQIGVFFSTDLEQLVWIKNIFVEFYRTCKAYATGKKKKGIRKNKPKYMSSICSEFERIVLNNKIFEKISYKYERGFILY